MKNRLVKYSALLGSASALALTVSAPVGAQETEAAAPEEESRRMNTVEVTATRREGTTVQDVPIAVTALDPETRIPNLSSTIGRLNPPWTLNNP